MSRVLLTLLILLLIGSLAIGLAEAQKPVPPVVFRWLLD
jgi:hypothetical protein